MLLVIVIALGLIAPGLLLLAAFWFGVIAAVAALTQDR